MEFRLSREPLADAFFGFPDVKDADLQFVTEALGFLEYPALVVDSDLRIVAANLQARDTLAWAKSVSPDENPEGVLPPALAEVVARRLRKRVHRIVKDVAVIREPPFLFDLFISKGRIQGQTYTFVVLMTASTGQRRRGVPALQRLLEGFRGGAFVTDTEARFVNINGAFLDMVGFSRDELLGHHLNEFNTSEQALAYGRVFGSLIESPRVVRSPAVTYSTLRRGAFVSPMTSWTITDSSGDALGLVVIAGGASRPRPETAEIERRHVLLEKAADLMGEAIFITDLDGEILVMNPSAENLIRSMAGKQTFNIKTDIPWEIPATIDDVFARLGRGQEEFLLTTGVLRREEKNILRMRAFGLKRVSDEVQEVVFVCEDITQEEFLKQTLFQTTRRLAEDRALRDGILDSVDIPFCVVDGDLTILDVNTATARRFETTKQKLVGVKITDINPNLKETGLVDYVESAIEKGEVLHTVDYSHLSHKGERSSIELTLIPVELGGRTVCIMIAESEAEPGAGRAYEDIRLRAGIADAVLEDIAEGIFIIGKDGTFLYVNEGAAIGSSLPREHIVGRNVTDLIAMSDEEDLLTAMWGRILSSNETLRSGVIKSRSRVDGLEQFVDIVVKPLRGSDGSVEKYLVIVKYLREIKSLEHQVADYTANLENMVTDKTRELSDSNVLLATTAERVSRTARSGEIMASLTDRESVVSAFLRQAKDVIGADSLNLVIADRSVSPPKVEQHSLGAEPPEDRSASEVTEEAVSRMMLGSPAGKRAYKPLDNLILTEFKSGSESGLFICRRNEGRFTPIDVDLAHLLCTQLSFALPAAAYVAEQRREREKAECLRRIAFRIAGIASVKEAVRAVAEEVSAVIDADRFFWMVKEVGDLVWVTEIYNTDGSGAARSAHARLEETEEGAAGLFDIERAGDIPCERLTEIGGSINDECRFITGADGGGVIGVVREVLLERGLLEDAGTCAVVPVRLTQHSPSYICAHSDNKDAFTEEDICFLCLAASAVGRVWLGADAASSIRRLETTGETMSELAHDFRYPMAQITDLLRRLASGELSGAESKEAAAPLLADVERLSMLSREFINLSSPGSGKPEFIDLVQVLEGSLSLAAEDLERKSIRIEREFDREQPLPPVLASRNDVARVFINLIANSHDAVEEGGWIRLKSFMDQADGGRPRVTLTIENSGPPVPPAIRDDLFCPFKSTKEGGTGLGLFSARRRANANGGDVSFEVDEDGHERFRVWFPAAFE
jgi:PAS domain S-box-containing protein